MYKLCSGPGQPFLEMEVVPASDGEVCPRLGSISITLFINNDATPIHKELFVHASRSGPGPAYGFNTNFTH